jgi:hypothetical protein
VLIDITTSQIVTTTAWSKVERGVPQGSVLGPLIILIFINDLPKFINDKYVPILFANDTSILVTHSNPMIFYNIINMVFHTLNGWFKNNLLSLNFAKTHFIKFITKNNNQIEININYGNKLIPVITLQNFLV